MTAELRTWLPRDAFTIAHLDAALAAVLREWAMCWFASTDFGVVDVRRDPRLSQALASSQIKAAHGVLEASATGRGKRALLELGLGLDLEGLSLNEHDHAILDRMVERLLGDLIDRVARLLGPTSGPDLKLHSLTVAIGHRSTELLQLSFPDWAVVDAIKASVLQEAPATAIATRSHALGDVSITLEGLLGRIPLSIDELSTLAVGDILVIDRKHSAPVDLVVREGGHVAARGTLQHHGDRIAIQL